MDIQGNPLDISKNPHPELSPKMQGRGPRLKKALLIALIVLISAAAIGAAGYAGYKFSKRGEENAEPVPLADTKEEDKQEEKLTENSCYVTGEPALNLRRSASASAEILTIIPYGTVIEKEEESSDGKWLKVTYGGQTGWVSADFCSKEKPALPDIQKTDFIALGRVNLNGGTAEPVEYHDFTGDGKQEAIVKVKRGNLHDYYIFGYVEFELKSYHERKGLSGLTLSYSGVVLEESSTTSGNIKWRFENGEFKQA